MKLTLYKNEEDLIIRINSIIVALLLASGTITSTLSRISIFAHIHNNIIILGCILLLMFIVSIKTKKIIITTPSLLMILFVFLWYCYTLLFFGNDCSLTVIQFIFYAIIPIYAIGQKIDGEYILKFTLYFSLISVININSFFTIQHEQYAQAYMGNIYPLLTPVIAAMIHFKLYRKKVNLLIVIAYIYNLYIAIQMLLYANRGAVICLLFCLMVLIINSYNATSRNKFYALKIILVILFFILGTFIVLNAYPLLNMLSSWLKEIFGNVPSFITKMIRYLRIGDVSDGRTKIDAFTLKEISAHPIIGHGIETFSSYAYRTIGVKWPYPHQYIYQYLFEGGIIFGAIPVYLSLSLSIKVLLTRIVEKKDFSICCVLVCSCIPKLLFSTDIWASPIIWMLITYSLIYILKNNKFFNTKSKLYYK